MKLNSIFIYPIKSLSGIELTAAEMQIQGLQYDRRWMLIDEKGKFLTQRNDAQMALIKTAISKESLLVKKEGFGTISIPLHEARSGHVSGNENAPLEPIKVWNDLTEATDTGRETAEWFSDLLGRKCRLMRISAKAVRKNTLPHRNDEKQVSFADSQPILIVNEASLKELNTRLETPILMERFRANFVVDSSVAYEEDDWKTFRVSGLNFKITKACGRCNVINIDQQTAIANKEVFDTLATYRFFKKNVNFGMRAKWLPTGEEQSTFVQIGDEVTLNQI